MRVNEKVEKTERNGRRYRREFGENVLSMLILVCVLVCVNQVFLLVHVRVVHFVYYLDLLQS